MIRATLTRYIRKTLQKLILSNSGNGVDHDSVSGTGRTERLTGHQDDSVANPGPTALDNELLDNVCELLNIFRNRSTSGYDTIMQTHLLTGPLLRTQRQNRNVYACFTEQSCRRPTLRPDSHKFGRDILDDLGHTASHCGSQKQLIRRNGLCRACFSLICDL